MSEKSWKDIFGKKTRLNWLKSEVDILRRELDSYKNFRKKDDERNYEKITKCIAKTAFVEVQIEGAMMPLKNRIGTLEQQVNDLMNENVDLISHLRAVEKKVSPKEKELKIYRDVERGGYVLKEKELEPRIGDLVVSLKNPTDIRKVVSNGFGFQLVGIREITVYNHDALVKDFLSDWKVLVKREDIK